MADYGIKITKATKDVTSTDPQDYQFWSKYRNKSIKKLTSITITTHTGDNHAAITGSYHHDFGYIPQYMVFVTSIVSGYVNCDWHIYYNYDKDGNIGDETLSAYANNDYIYVSANLNYYYNGEGVTHGIAQQYIFDVVLFMEEVETA